MDDKIFGLSEKALQLCEDRAVLLTHNLVNSSTPHYKARDIDFYKVLQDNIPASAMKITEAKHIAPTDQINTATTTQFRVPMQKSLDGNTVDEEIERKNFIENAMRYQVNLTLIENKTDQLLRAIKGE